MGITGFIRRPKNLPVLLIPVLLLVWAQYVVPDLARSSFTHVALFDSPYRQPLPFGGTGEAVAENVVIIVIDGLRVDTSRGMSSINQLRQGGADRVVTVGQPSFSLPGWTVIGTGAWQEQSGVASNFFGDSITLDTIFDSARRADLSTGLVGHEDWGQLYATGVDGSYLFPSTEDSYTDVAAAIALDRSTTDMALQMLTAGMNLTLIHLLGVDTLSHGTGPHSPESQQVVANVNTQLGRILDAIDLETTAVLVTADHGHIDRGGHGGWEDVVLEIPLVAKGRGIVPGQYSDGTQADIAPTVAALLGLSIPAHNQGDILFDQLEMSDATKAARSIDLASQLAGRVDSMLGTIGDSRRVNREPITVAQTAMSVGNHPGAMTSALGVVDQANELWDSARSDRIRSERWKSLPWLLLLVPVALYLWWWRRERWNWKAPLVGTVVYFGVWYALFFLVRKLSFSISMFNIESDIVDFITARVIDSLIALAVATVVVALIRRRAPLGEVARDVVHTMLLVALVLGFQVLVFAVMWDMFPTWYIPDLRAAFKYYLDLYQTSMFWPRTTIPAAVIMPLLAIGVAALFGRRSRTRT